MNGVIFEISCVPIPKARPRLGRFGVYTPQKSSEFDTALSYYLRSCNIRIEKEEVAIFSVFRLPAPKSWTKKKYLDMLGKSHLQKPDVDNLQKQVLDSMKKALIFEDDCQVSTEYSEKIWSSQEEAGITLGFFWGQQAKSDMIRYIAERR